MSPLAPLSSVETIGFPIGHRFSFLSLRPRFLRIDSPFSSMRWALCTSRSRMESARVGSPIWACQLATGNCEVSSVKRV